MTRLPRPSGILFSRKNRRSKPNCCVCSMRLLCKVLTKEVIELMMVEKVIKDTRATTTPGSVMSQLLARTCENNYW